MMSLERQLEEELVKKLGDLKYEHRTEIRDRASLEQNFREEFQTLNHLRLSDGELQRLLVEMTTPDVFTAAHTLAPPATAPSLAVTQQEYMTRMNRLNQNAATRPTSAELHASGEVVQGDWNQGPR
jgi:hypothetical protein